MVQNSFLLNHHQENDDGQPDKDGKVGSVAAGPETLGEIIRHTAVFPKGS